MQTFEFILGLTRSTVEPQWWRRVKVMEWEKQKRHRETSEKVGKVTGWKGLGGQYWKNTGKRGGSNWQWALGHEWGTVWQWASEARRRDDALCHFSWVTSAAIANPRDFDLSLVSWDKRISIFAFENPAGWQAPTTSIGFFIVHYPQ